MIAEMPVIRHIPVVFLQPLLKDVATLAVWASEKQPASNWRKDMILQHREERLEKKVERVVCNRSAPKDHLIQWRKSQAEQQQEHRNNDLRVVLVELKFPLQQLHFHVDTAVSLTNAN